MNSKASALSDKELLAADNSMGMVGSHVEHSAAMRFTQLQAELDLAEFAERGRIATHSLASIKTILSSSSSLKNFSTQDCRH